MTYRLHLLPLHALYQLAFFNRLLDAGVGLSELHIGLYCVNPPDFESPALPANPEHHAPKHRYISIDPSVEGNPEAAIKVEIAEMKRCAGDMRRSCLLDSDCRRACENDLDAFCDTSAQCAGNNCVETGPCVNHPDIGLSWFVQEPFQPHDFCRPSCGDEDWYARLDSAMYSQTWEEYSTLHIGDCEISPCVTYNVYACDPNDPENCSLPLVVPTQVMPWRQPRNYADVAGPVTPPLEFTPPDGFANVVDVSAYLLTNHHWGTPNLPRAHPTWVDVIGCCEAGIPPNYILNVSDLSYLYASLAWGWPYESIAGGLNPGACP